ncbi:hypothetical protein [Ralstonia soli]|uniref:Uncharacterized protein n=1 Tax=Ralstonia soli TaxID=2953896 RepID=A0ABT1ATQ0_9RALS|nr:hypothetical protein [Ralstonia soli]MCO5401591.1 hypothetical protein [Ralstonia soli]
MKQRRQQPKRTSFASQPRRIQKAAYIGVKNRIRRAAPILGGKFFTRDYMHGKNGWLGAGFLGHKAPVFYNLSIQTTLHAYKEAVQEHAWALSYERAPDCEPSFLHGAVINPKTGLYEIPPREPVRYPELDGMTRREWVESQHQTIAERGDIEVFEAWTLQADYVYGIGLHATIDVPFLTVDVLNHFIDRFLAQEADYRAITPTNHRYDQVTHWGIEPNAMIDPWDWARAEAQAGESTKDVE